MSVIFPTGEMLKVLTSKLHEHTIKGGSFYEFWCPGCKTSHLYPVKREADWCLGSNPSWFFDGSMEKPTFTPSLKEWDDKGIVCHINLTSGIICFDGDCRHELRGKSVPMVDLPYDN